MVRFSANLNVPSRILKDDEKGAYVLFLFFQPPIRGGESIFKWGWGGQGFSHAFDIEGPKASKIILQGGNMFWAAQNLVY